MPVVRLELRRLTKMVGASQRAVLDRLPFIGLDIEEVGGGFVRVEYSPNRPDFGTDIGIARALRGVTGREVGLPRYHTTPSGVIVRVDGNVARTRPQIACAIVEGLRLGEEEIRQLISLQEDLHNGLGRRRRVAAVGLHDFDSIEPPIRYWGASGELRFLPLGGKKVLTIREILSSTPEGLAYGGAVPPSGPFPVIADSKGAVLSLPPIINGDATKVSTKTRKILIEVTGTKSTTVDNVLAVLATTLSDAGGKLRSVSIQCRPPRITPDLVSKKLPLSPQLIVGILGLKLSKREIVDCLGRSRLGLAGNTVLIPPYRSDMMHPVDVAEEVALGYGFDRIGPIYPPSPLPGSLDRFESFLDGTSTVMADSGMVEMMTYELVDPSTLYASFGRPKEKQIAVMNPKSREHSVLRDSLLPPMLSSLTSNVKAEYPQRVYEIGRVYSRDGAAVEEEWNLGCLVAHSAATFSEAKMYLQSTCRAQGLAGPKTGPSKHWAFASGRTATVTISGVEVGYIGEVVPEALGYFGLGVPVSGFEVSLTKIHKLLK